MSGANITASTTPSSAINGGISVLLPTTTMATRTSTQIGYQAVSNVSGLTVNNNTTVTIATLTLSPQNSVWIVQFTIQINSSQSPTFSNFQLYATPGASFGSGKKPVFYSPSTGMNGGFYSENGVCFNNAGEAVYTGCCVMVNTDASNKISLGCFFNSNASSYLLYGNFTATRIA